MYPRAVTRLLEEEGLSITRDGHGVPHVRASDEPRLYRGMGYCHAVDRGLQLLLMRVLGRGQLSLLDGSQTGLDIDTFFRRMNWVEGAEAEVARLSPAARAACQAYCDGINLRLARKRPWELGMAGYEHTPWLLEDCFLMGKMIGYLTLAQSQGELEHLLCELVQAGVPRARLDELFPGVLGGLDEELVRRVKLGQRLVPAELAWAAGARMMASNNWVVAGSRTASGRAILANDPHLEVNRLPNVWYEIALAIGERWGLGATVPGLPALVLGRTPDLAWGATYTFADTIDSWIEDCKDGKYRRGDDWVAFRQRRETIARKKGATAEVVFHENDHGVLDGDPALPGLYLTTRWSGAGLGARSIEGFLALWQARDVEAGMRHLGAVEVAFNWVLADAAGRIGYQMSGLVPVRREGVQGMAPLPGWDAGNDWRGYQPAEALPRALDPEAGFFVTANDDLGRWGTAHAISVSMGPYRAARIAERLGEKTGVTVADMQAIQLDNTSLHARRFMALLRPLLPATAQGKLLAEWDLGYDAASRGAWLFERFYRELLQEVFGAAFGAEVARHLAGETGVFIDFYDCFDRVLLSERSAWLGGETRDEVWRRVAARALEVEPRTWGESQRVVLSHMLLGGKLPRWMGFDRGPIVLEGGRATPRQGQVYRAGGRATSFAPSYRMVTDFAEAAVHTSMAGGPSDRRFSKWYVSELERWLKGDLKKVEP